MRRRPRGLAAAQVLRQGHVEGYKRHLVEKRSGELYKEAAKIIRQELGPWRIDDISERRLNAIIRGVHNSIEPEYKKFKRFYLVDLQEFAEESVRFEIDSVKKLTKLELKKPSGDQVRALYKSVPLAGLRGADQGLMLADILAKYLPSQVQQIEGRIRAGFYNGTTTQEILRDLIGTRKAGYTDGALGKFHRDTSTIVRTGVQHVAAQAREAVYERNSDVIRGVRIVATLDDKTSDICQALDGEEFALGDGPRPPFHPNCRTTTAPVTVGPDLAQDGTRIARDPDDGRKREFVDKDITYFEWIKTTPREYQESALGKTRAAILNSPGMTAEKYKKLTFENNFTTKTLEQLREEEPKIFRAIEKE